MSPTRTGFELHNRGGTAACSSSSEDDDDDADDVMQLFVRPPWGGGVLTVEATPRETLAGLRVKVAARLLGECPLDKAVSDGEEEGSCDAVVDDAWTTQHRVDHLRLVLGGRELTCNEDGDDDGWGGGGGGGGETTLEELHVRRGATLEAFSEFSRLRGGMPVVKGAAKKAAAADDGGGGGGAKVSITPFSSKKRDNRTALSRFLQHLPAWWEALNQNNTSLYLFSERSRFRRGVWWGSAR
jgi:hypothetical protein